MRDIEAPRSPVVLIGPTTAGKSAVAEAMSDMTGSTIITADRGYMYARPDLLWLGLGLMPNELDDGRPRRLFGSLEPHDRPLNPAEYLARVRNEVAVIHSLGGTAIIEGCTRRYNNALLHEYGVDHAVGITWPSEAALYGKLTRRVQTAVALGMYDEIEAALAAGLGNTHPMSTVPYIHATNVLAGLEDRPYAEAAMARELALISMDHRESYLAIGGLNWFVHENGNEDQIAAAALASLNGYSLDLELAGMPPPELSGGINRPIQVI